MSAEAQRSVGMGDGVVAIDTHFVRPRFDASHLIVEAGRAAFVDVGVNDTVPLLLHALGEEDLSPADVDLVFLTHVHLDHAGGAGLLLQELPNARAVLHPRGAPHMSDPQKLVRGAQAVYGPEQFASDYGEIMPIDDARIIVANDGDEFALAGRTMRTVFTEGHARHHYVLEDPQSRAVFTGDSFGLSYREFDTQQGEFIYPTTTPVHFDPVEAHKSIDRIIGLGPERLFLTHYSEVLQLPRLADDMHRRIDDFVRIARQHASDTDRSAKMHQTMYAYFERELTAHGYTGTKEQMHDILKTDVVLNTMGLEFWLDHT